MLILGIDPGLTKTGWGLVLVGVRGGLKYVAHGVIRPKSSECISKKLLFIKRGLSEVIDEHKPSKVCVEEVFVNIRNPISALKLGAARGAAILSVSEADLEFNECAPTVMKKSIAGHGHAKKEEVAAMVRKILKIKKSFVLPSDAADALAIAIELIRRD